MAFNIVQAGTNLWALNPQGGSLPNPLGMPTGVTLRSNLVPRFARFKQYVIVVNTPTRPITIDTNGSTRVLTPAAPSTAPVLSSAAGGGLVGNFLVKQTFQMLDGQGNVIAESGYGPVSNLGSLSAAAYLRAINLNLSADSSVNASGLYRTTSTGGVFFPWLTVPGNINTTIQDDTSDAGLGLIAGGVLGAPPDLTLCTQWQGRLWGVDRVDVDHLRWTEAGEMYAWGALDIMPIGPTGDDRYGITALAPRRDALGVGRRNVLVQVTTSDGVTFTPTTLMNNCGIVSQESVVVWRDTAYFLWLDGVYQWNDAVGVVCISDAGNVRSWFATDTYFNRGMFSQAFAVMDPSDVTYRLCLCAAGSLVPNRWVEYNIATGKWYGPHQTSAFTLQSAFLMRGANDQQYCVAGSVEGHLSVDTESRVDWGVVSILEDVITKPFTGGTPDRDTLFGEVSLYGEAQPSGTLTVTSTVGPLQHGFVNPPDTADLTMARNRLFRVGEGKHASLELTNAQLGVNPVLYGLTIPTTDVGRR